MKRRKLWKRDLEKRRQNVPCVLGGILLALTLCFAANAQAPALGDSPSQSSSQALKKALEQGGFMENGKFNVADLLAIYDTGIVPSYFGNVLPGRSATDPAVITVLAAAYVWGLGPEYNSGSLQP